MLTQFFFTFQDEQLLQASIEEYKAKLVQLKVRIQPFLVCVGTLLEPESFFVILDGIKKFKFNDCLKALDFLFKTYFSIQSRYPLHSETLWLAVQTIFYDIHLPSDVLTNSIQVLQGEIDLIFKQKTIQGSIKEN